MRSYISYDELEELGETIVRAYINKTRRYNALCVDIEGLVTDYLGLTVVYETIVEDDLNKIAFLSNGKRPLRVVRDGKRVEVVFPKNTAVLDKVLLNEKESSRRRFTLGHEGAHSIIAKQNPMQDVGCFHNTFDPERQYTLEERRELLSFSEAQADRLSSVFLMPRFILEKVMKKYKLEPKRMRMVQPYADKEPNMVLIDAALGGKSMIKVEPALVVYNADGSYTEQLLKVYG